MITLNKSKYKQYDKNNDTDNSDKHNTQNKGNKE